MFKFAPIEHGNNKRCNCQNRVNSHNIYFNITTIMHYLETCYNFDETFATNFKYPGKPQPLKVNRAFEMNCLDNFDPM